MVRWGDFDFICYYENMKNIYIINLGHVLHSKVAVISWLIAIAVVSVIWWYFIDLDLTIGNMWHTVAYSELVLYGLFALLFGLFIATSVYKYRYFRDINASSVTTGGIGWIAGLLVAWCPACSITLASWLWVASFLWFLPYNGMELKVIAIIVLWYTLYVLLRDLEVCSRKKKTSFIFISSITMNKVLLWLVITAWVAVSWWALFWYAQDQWLIASTTSQVEQVQAYDTQQDGTVAQPTVEEPVVDDTYVPSTAPTWVCWWADGACGCGWGWTADWWGCGWWCGWSQAQAKPSGCGCWW